MQIREKDFRTGTDNIRWGRVETVVRHGAVVALFASLTALGCTASVSTASTQEAARKEFSKSGSNFNIEEFLKHVEQGDVQRVR
jgi:hypothetical protein